MNTTGPDEGLLDGVRRVRFATLPTPLREASRLSDTLGGPRIWIKRDDLTGVSLGGNKVRKLEYLLSDALRQGADTVLTVGGTQSNHACQTAASASLLGLHCILLLARPDGGVSWQGNLLLERILGAEIRFVDASSPADLEGAMEEVAATLRREGKRPNTIPLGGSNGLGAVAYAHAAGEIMRQSETLSFTPDCIVTACGTGGTLAGLVLGRSLGGFSHRLVGVNVGAVEGDLRSRLAGILEDAYARLGLPSAGRSGVPDGVEILEEHVGEGYGIPTEEGLDAIRLLAVEEGIFLDPVYTSKAFAGLRALIRSGRFRRGENVVFIHTGGTASIFAYARRLLGR